MYEVLLPRLDAGMKEGTIVQWLKKNEDQIQKGEPLVKIEGEKIVFDVEAQSSGILRILVKEGTLVPVGTTIAIITSEGEQTAQEIKTEDLAAPSRERVAASPAAKRIAKQRCIDIDKIEGSGPSGLITEKDVLNASRAEGPNIPSQLDIREVVPLIGMRKSIADRMTYSYRTIPHVAISTDVDVSESVKLQKLIEESKNTRIPLTAILTKVVAKALEGYPIVNSTFEDDRISVLGHINIGVAVALEDGLVVPVVHNADQKDLLNVASDIENLLKKAKERTLTSEDLQNGTFTITNLGGFGIDAFSPIINPPQAAILGVGRIKDRTTVLEKQVRIAPIMTLTLVFDHRILDGAKAAQFLGRIAELLTSPSDLFSNLP